MFMSCTAAERRPENNNLLQIVIGHKIEMTTHRRNHNDKLGHLIGRRAIHLNVPNMGRL